jgi:Ca2+-binding RTX toxin-like protein
MLSPNQNVQPTQVIQLPSGTDAIQFQALDANGNPVILADPGVLDVTFATDGVFTGSLDVDPLTRGSVSLPGPFGDVAVSDTTTGLNVLAVGRDYLGPVAGLQHQYVYSASDNVNISVSDDNWFLHGGPGEDAIAAHGGYNVLDGGTGSNFLTGGSGTDTFFVDDRGPPADIWSTVNGFHTGDDATVFGVVPNSDDSNIQWFDNQGAVGYTGLTLHVPTPGQPTASLTLPGYATSDLSNGRLAVQFGNEADGTPFMHIIASG